MRKHTALKKAATDSCSLYEEFDHDCIMSSRLMKAFQKPKRVRVPRTISERRSVCRKILRQRLRTRLLKVQKRKSSAAETSRAFLFKKSLFKRMIQESESKGECLSSMHEIEDSDCVDRGSEEQNLQFVEVPALGEVIPVSCGPLIDGEFFQLTSGFLLNSGITCYIPVVDNHGFLLGDFSKLDDLAII